MITGELRKELGSLPFMIRRRALEQEPAQELAFDAHALCLGQRLPHQAASPQRKPRSEPGIVGKS